MLNKFKLILSKLMVAQKNKKFFVQVQNNKLNYFLLNFLWDEGFIHGYFLFRRNLIVFFKVPKTDFSLLENIIFLKGSYSSSFFKNLDFLEKKIVVFVVNDKGIFLHSHLVKLGLGGFQLSKL
mgnify:CR=1 FL=1